MRHPRIVWAFCVSLALAASAQEKVMFETNPNSAELQTLAKPLEVDESKYGCGPVRQPGRTYHVALKGDDKADGLSWQTAWRTVRHGVSRLAAGDTLVIGEGEYVETDLKVACGGQPGRPITLMAAPRQRVVVTGGLKPPLSKTSGLQFTYDAACEL
ncbi:MAG: hypothetical protein FJ279_32830, partial [Planctomycetes bacterium]|nr:hypothetical protein [Planctomycetota bacterium]